MIQGDVAGVAVVYIYVAILLIITEKILDNSEIMLYVNSNYNN